jgi:hypothetical protein
MVTHYDVLIDGLNTELSAYDTIQRRPGWTSFLAGTTVDAFQYKDLNGNIFILRDTGTSLKQAATTLKTNSAGAGAWSVVGRGNFIYGTNGKDTIRVDDTGSALGTTYQWGSNTPATTPTLTFSSLGYFNAVTGFIPTADVIGGSITITDPSNQRTMTVTQNATTVHFNVTYTGNQISQNNSYKTTNVQTQTGTAPNQTDVNVITTVTGYIDLLTSAGTENGIMQFFSNTGVSTLDFDVAASSLTLSGLSAIINTQAAVNWAGLAVNVPASAANFLNLFTSTTIVAGLYHQPGQPPFILQTGNALNMTYGGYYNYGLGAGQTVQFTSGLFDVTNPQMSLEASIGSAPRLYQYVSPAVNVTDTFTGQIEMSIVNGSGTSSNIFTFTAQTLEQMAVTMRSASWNPIYVQTGTTCYLIVRNFQASTPSTTQDSVICMTLNSMVDLADTNLNFQSWTFLESNDWAQLPQQGIQIAYAIRDVFSGGLSNLSPAVTVGPQIYPARWGVSLSLPYGVYNPALPAPEAGNQNIEVYRTVDGGSSYLYEQIMAYQNLTNYTTTFLITDAGLNEQLVGPINEQADPPPIGLTNIVAHTGRLFGIVANRVYYSGGPDTTNGNGDEAWPPGNYFAFPGACTDIKSLASGLIVALGDDLHVITGADSSSYYAKPWLAGYGISNKNAWVKDGDGLYVYTSKQQLQAIFPGEESEIGFDVGDILLASYPATTTSVTFHRGSALDTALYISNGSNTILRWGAGRKAWSPKQAPSVSAGRVKSLETSTGVNTLLNSTTGGVWQRSLSTFTDNGSPYAAFFTIGVIQLAPQGQQAMLNNIAMQAQALGTLPQLWVLFNEINSNFVPFTQLLQPVNDPPDAPGSQSLWAKRWYTQQTLTPFPTGLRLINLAQVKVVFSSTDTVKNEVIGVFLRDNL